MTEPAEKLVADVFEDADGKLLDRWMEALRTTAIRREELRTPEELRQECASILSLLCDVTKSRANFDSSKWGAEVDRLARARVSQGFSPEDTSNFLFALRGPLIEMLQDAEDGRALALIREASRLLDGLHNRMISIYVRARDDVIARQQEEMLELSTPVVKLWDGIVAMPLIGTLDSRRAQVVTETLLERITETGSEIAIIDITGVPMVDTLVAQHLIKTVTAARLMGAECILSGIRPQIAQTIVQLGVHLDEVTTKASLEDAFRLALRRKGKGVHQVTASHVQ